MVDIYDMTTQTKCREEENSFGVFWKGSEPPGGQHENRLKISVSKYQGIMRLWSITVKGVIGSSLSTYRSLIFMLHISDLVKGQVEQMSQCTTV